MESVSVCWTVVQQELEGDLPSEPYMGQQASYTGKTRGTVGASGRSNLTLQIEIQPEWKLLPC